jgi:cytoskeletal protein CcmA (bactofilin family)
VVFRRDSKVDAFQRQISALRHQLGGENDEMSFLDIDRSRTARTENSLRADLPAFDQIESDFSRSPRELTQPTALNGSDSTLPSIPAIDTLTSVVAHTTSWSGNLESSGSLHIHGRVEGSLTARDDVFVAEEADVDAIITAANVTIAGNVRGSVRCTERFELLPRGKVAGDVQSPVIVIHDGGIIAGQISMAPSNEVNASVPTVRAARGGD